MVFYKNGFAIRAHNVWYAIKQKKKKEKLNYESYSASYASMIKNSNWMQKNKTGTK